MLSIRLAVLLVVLPLGGCAAPPGADTRLSPDAQAVMRRAVPSAPLSAQPSTSPPAPAVPPAAPPSRPAPVTGCDPGGCWSGGQRYQGGSGNTYVNPGGRPCQSNGTWMQCF